MSTQQGDIMPLRSIFGAASMNDHEYSHLWVEGGAQFIPRLTSLVGRTGFQLNVVDMYPFQNPEQDVLGQIFMNNQSDKSTTHNYHVLYSYILNKLGMEKPLDVLEVGLGTNNPALVSSMGEHGRPGASLYSFREYLPNASIYGADIDKDILFEDTRIKTAFVDQMKLDTFREMHATLGVDKYDLIIDDGLHSIGANFNTMTYALDHLKKDGWFVVEDIGKSVFDHWTAIDYIVKGIPNLETFMVKTTGGYLYQNDSYMYAVHKKS